MVASGINHSMSRNGDRGYEAPDITEYGSVESITEDHMNKSSYGTDSDIRAVNLEGSAPHV